MKEFVCKNCGATGLLVKNGYMVCEYCDTRFMLTAEDFDFYGHSKKNSPGISLGGDIERLLQKCRMDPRNARRYANLILDIDPDNEEALNYI